MFDKRSKEPKKSEEATAAKAIIRKAWISRNRECQEARTLLLQLETSFSEHTAALRVAEIRCSNFSRDGAGRIMQGGATACLRRDPIQLAKELIAGKDLPAIIMEEQKQLEPFYSRINFGEGNADHVVIFKEWDRERAALLILKESITLQTKAVAAASTNSMAEFSKAIAEVRAATARKILAIMAELHDVVDLDRSLADGLGPDEIQCLRPKPFPMRPLSSEAVSWLLDAVSEKLIEQAELRNLQQEEAEPALA
jgi:hypothetical protein